MYSDRIADIVKEKTEGMIFHLRKLKIGFCHACDYCKTMKEGECIQSDDMTALYSAIRNADRVVLLSPVYWWQVTAQMKAFMDRLYALKEEDWKNKKFIVILNGAAENDDKEFLILKEAFDEMFSYLSVPYSYLGVGTEDEEAWKKNENMVRKFVMDNI